MVDLAIVPAPTGVDVTLASSATNELARKGCLVWLHASRPSLRVSLSPASLGLPPSIGDVASLPSVKPPGETFGEFARFEGRARKALEKYSLGGGDGKFVPYALLDRALAEIEEARQGYLAHVPRYLESYDVDVANAKQRWEIEAGTIYDRLGASDITREEFIGRIMAQLRDAWPASSELTERFSMRVRVLQLALPSLESMGAMDAPFAVQTARKLAEESVAPFIAGLADELRARTAEVCSDVLRVLTSENTRFTQRTINPLAEFISVFRGLNVVGDVEAERALREVERAMQSKTATALGSDGKAEFVAALQAAANLAPAALERSQAETDKLLRDRFGGGVSGRRIG